NPKSASTTSRQTTYATSPDSSENVTAGSNEPRLPVFIPSPVTANVVPLSVLAVTRISKLPEMESSRQTTSTFEPDAATRGSKELPALELTFLDSLKLVPLSVLAAKKISLLPESSATFHAMYTLDPEAAILGSKELP